MATVHGYAPHAIVISGDVTDAGAVDAWRHLDEVIDNDDVLKDKLILAPGNHDLNIVRPGVLESVFHIGHISRRDASERAKRYLDHANKWMGDRATVVCPFTGAVSTFGQVLQRAHDDLEAWQLRKQKPFHMTPEELLQRLFPMVVSIRGQDSQEASVLFVVWNSVAKNRWPVFNAIGRIWQDQVNRMRALMQDMSSTRPVMHVVHHQLGVPFPGQAFDKQSNSHWRAFTGAGMAVEDPGTLINWLKTRRQRTILLHGHHHKLFVVQSKADGSTLVSAPSATQGCEESYIRDCAADHEPKWLLLDVQIDGEHSRLRQLAVNSALHKKAC